MAQFISPLSIAPTYRGLQRIFQFTNWDGEFVPYNCGQAAGATYLAFHNLLPTNEETASDCMRQIEQMHPPDIIGGWLGTSRRRVERICRSSGLEIDSIEGEQSLRDAVSEGRPAIVMLEVPGATILKRWQLPAGHWMVVYGFDDENVHLTNWGQMSWEIFRQRWNMAIPRVIGMRNQALVL